MTIISIIGVSGVGKSYLVKQLASLECAPAFLEGEEGVLPEEILKDVFQKTDPVKRHQWFADRHKITFEKARKISDIDIDCYVDGSNISFAAVLIHEPESYKKDIIKIIKSIEHLTSDKLVLITATKEFLLKSFDSRGRESEKNDETIKRALKMQDEFIKLTKPLKNAIIVDRSNLDFSKEDDLKLILKKIKNI